jgi:hypothetical protein
MVMVANGKNSSIVLEMCNSLNFYVRSSITYAFFLDSTGVSTEGFTYAVMIHVYSSLFLTVIPLFFVFLHILAIHY